MSKEHEAFYLHEGKHSVIEITIAERPLEPVEAKGRSRAWFAIPPIALVLLASCYVKKQAIFDAWAFYNLPILS